MMVVGSSSHLVGCESVDTSGSSIPLQSAAKDLGVHLDQIQLVKQHSSGLCRIAFLAFWGIASIRPFLTVP